MGGFVSLLTRLRISALFLAIPFLLPLLWAHNSASDPPFRNPDLSPDDRAADDAKLRPGHRGPITSPHFGEGREFILT
jgi:hypothetical protein